MYSTPVQGSQPSDESPVGMGATLDIQRQQRMDMLDQQLLLAQYSESRRNARRQQQVDKQHNYWLAYKQTLQAHMECNRRGNVHCLV